MNFTDNMIRDVLFALQHPEARAQHADDGHFEPDEAIEGTAEIEFPRPAGKHFRDDPEVISEELERQEPDPLLTMVDEANDEDELETLARDYMVAATNQVVRKLERVS
ncbi:MAG: hypothetical protein FWH40_04200 [Coriobacteriia bacterium]|nr:hypothetical protein [Coriobacteriia bacterium]